MLRSYLLAMLFVWTGGASAQPPQGEHINSDLLKPQLTDVGGSRRLHMACEGVGYPTVVFQQGGEGAIPNWRQVQPVIARLTRTCVYDRAGFGLSDAPDGPVTGTATTDDLHALLKARGETLPVVFAGHSIGGFHATLYANRFPQEVAGMVLVDPGFAMQNNPTHPEDRKLFLASLDRGNQELADCAKKAREGQLSNDDLKGCFKLPGGWSDAERTYMLQALIRPAWYEAELSQSLNYFPSAQAPESLIWREERVTRRHYGDTPLIVLSGGRLYRDVSQTDRGFAESSADWRKGHELLANRSDRSEFLFLPDAGHFIQRNRPDVVIDAITRVVETVRAEHKGQQKSRRRKPRRLFFQNRSDSGGDNVRRGRAADQVIKGRQRGF